MKKDNHLKEKVSGKLAIMLILMVISITTASGIMLNYSLQKEMRDQENYLTLTTSMIDSQLSRTETYLNNLVANNDDFVFLTSDDANVRTLSLVKLRQSISKEMVLNESIFYYYIYNEADNFYLSIAGDNGNSNATPDIKKYIQTEMREEDNNTSGWKLKRIKGASYLNYAFQYGDIYIGAFADTSFLLADAKNSLSDKKEILFLTDGEGTTLDDMDREDIEVRLEQQKMISIGGKHYICIQQKIDDKNISIVLGQPIGTAKWEVHWIAILIVILLALAIVPVILFRRYINDKVIRPISRMVSKMNKIGNGELALEYTMQKNDFCEFIILDSTLNSMLTQIEELQRIKLDFLNLQSNPHFTLNGLVSVYNRLDKPNEAETRECVMLMIKHLRYMINLREKTISAREEIRFVKNYVELYKTRLSFPIILHVNQEEQFEDVKIVPYAIQTMVENCVKYGSSADGTVRIEVGVRKEDTKTEIYIADSGKGFSDSVITGIQMNQRMTDDSGNDHIGISNVKSRFKLIFGDSVELILENRQQGGAVVRILYK